MDIGAPELLIILFIVVLLFGPGRLVKMGGELGRGMREFRQGLNGADTEEKDPAPEDKQS
jgi:sec-independent protein translocase protein TatA